MSSDDEDFDLNYGIEDEFGKSFGKNKPNDPGKKILILY